MIPEDEAEAVRRRIRAHFDSGGTVAELGPDKWKPQELDKPFALVGGTPPAKIRDAWYRCSFCETDLKFKVGSIVLCYDRKLRLIGDECWRDYFNADAWKEARQDYLSHRKRAAFSEVRSGLQEEVSSFLRSVREILSHTRSHIRQSERIGSTLAREMPPVWRRLNDARRNGGMLMVERIVSAESRAIQEAAAETTGRRAPVERFTLVPKHRVLGLSVLDRRDLAGPLEASLKASYAADEKLRTTDWDELPLRTFSRTIAQVLQSFRSLADDVDDAIAFKSDLDAFFSSANLIGLREWSADPDCDLWLDGVLIVSGDTIRFEPEQGEAAQISAPELVGAAFFPSPDRLRGLLDRGGA
jgi:hypothetical protein